MEDEKKGNQEIQNVIPLELKILCRGKLVYVPYDVALKYDFLKAYLERWDKKDEYLELNIFPPEKLQEEFDKRMNCSVSEYLQCTELAEESKKDIKEDDTIYFEDLFLVRDKKILINSIVETMSLSKCYKIVKLNGRVGQFHFERLVGNTICLIFQSNLKHINGIKFRTNFVDLTSEKIVKFFLSHTEYLEHFFPRRYKIDL